MDIETESAFAVYTGKTNKLSKSQKKRKNKKERESSITSTQNKLEKLELIAKKKAKKKKILGESEDVDTQGKSGGKRLMKLEKKIMMGDFGEAVKSKKKKVKVPDLAANGQAEESQETTNSFQTSDDSGMNVAEIDPTIKTKKKVKISSKLPVSTKNGSFQKKILSTPRFVRKAENVPMEVIEPKGKSKILNAVDEYVVKKKAVVEAAPSHLEVVLTTKQTPEKTESSESYGEFTLSKILQPLTVPSFFRDYWEKKPVHIPGNDVKFSKIMSTQTIDTLLRENVVMFGKHLDVTSYENGERKTHNPEGRAQAHVVWDFYSNGCSVRLLNPQYFVNSVHTLNSNLQELFGCFVGANVYLTPPNSQGFAPHFDDIEAFILQLEGSKCWKIYSPLEKNCVLPRNSSRNLSEEEVGQPIMEVTLTAGDVLYFPRGYIHQAKTLDQHSLHITLSTYQKTSFADLLEKIFPSSLKKIASKDVDFRKGLPLGYLSNAGFAYKTPNEKRRNLVKTLKELMHKIADSLDVDQGMDEMGMKYISEALPPVLTPMEAACSVYGGGLRMDAGGKMRNHINITFDTKVRWIRKHCFRMFEEEVINEDGDLEKQTRLYHSLDNSREFQKEPPQFIIIPSDMVTSVLHLVSAYPSYTRISDLPFKEGVAEPSDVLILIGDLWDTGLLTCAEPLEPQDVGSAREEDLSIEKIQTNPETKVLLDLLEPVPNGKNEKSALSDSDDEPREPDLIAESTRINEYICQEDSNHSENSTNDSEGSSHSSLLP